MVSILILYLHVIPSVTNLQPTFPSAVTLTHNMSKTKAQTDHNTPHSNLEHEEYTKKSEEHDMTCALSFPICLLSWLTRASPDVCSFLYICIFVYGYSFTLI